jgi:pimeloyl-ACP methyl ester carboxylesterase
MDKVTSADGTQIAFERTGSGPPLVLVHGGAAGDHTRWELAGVRATLAEHFTVYAVDRRGRGESGDAAEYAMEREYEDVVAVLDAISEPAILLGHSSGALFSMEAALRTNNIRKLILYEPVFQIGDYEPYSEPLVAEMESLLREGQNEEALILFMRDAVNLTPPEIDALRAGPSWQRRLNAVHTIPREERAGGEYQFDAARFGSMTTPTLLLVGEQSLPPFIQSTEAVNEALPNSHIFIIEGHGHVAMLTATERFIEVVLAFAREAD